MFTLFPIILHQGIDSQVGLHQLYHNPHLFLYWQIIGDDQHYSEEGLESSSKFHFGGYTWKITLQTLFFHCLGGRIHLKISAKLMFGLFLNPEQIMNNSAG